MKKRFDIVGLGRAVLDLVGAVPRWPDLDEKMHIDEFAFEGGGQVATALAAASRMGAKTAIVGIIGDDVFGALIRKSFEEDGVDQTFLVSDHGTRSPFAFCLSDEETHKRTLFFSEKTGRGLHSPEIPRDVIANARFLHLDGNHTTCAVQAAEWAKATGVGVMLDAERRRDGMVRLLELADYIIASERFCREWTGYPDFHDGVRALAEEVGGFCGVTLGERGFIGVDRGEAFEIPAYLVRTIDTLGAGDVFHGAFLVGLLKGWSVRECAKLASATAAMTCRELGGRKGIPTFEEAVAFMEEQE